MASIPTARNALLAGRLRGISRISTRPAREQEATAAQPIGQIRNTLLTGRKQDIRLIPGNVLLAEGRAGSASRWSLAGQCVAQFATGFLFNCNASAVAPH